MIHDCDVSLSFTAHDTRESYRAGTVNANNANNANNVKSPVRVKHNSEIKETNMSSGTTFPVVSPLLPGLFCISPSFCRVGMGVLCRTHGVCVRSSVICLHRVSSLVTHYFVRVFIRFPLSCVSSSCSVLTSWFVSSVGLVLMWEKVVFSSTRMIVFPFWSSLCELSLYWACFVCTFVSSLSVFLLVLFSYSSFFI